MPSDTLPTAKILARADGASIAYHKILGQGPGVVFIHGLMSDMDGGKALAVEALCRDRGQAFVRFDCYGHGQSSGDFPDGTIGRWADDAVAVIDALTDGPQIVVGSSMGGWVMLLCALKRPERVAGLVGIAAAPDFTEDLMRGQLSVEQLATIERDGRVDVPSDYGDDPYIISKKLLDDGQNNLLLRAELPIDVPVRLIQGMQDEDVPYQTAGRIMDKLRTTDVEVTYVKAGDHRLSEPHDLDRLTRIVGGLIDTVEAK